MAASRSANATVAAYDAAVVTPSDSTIIPVTRALYVGTSGNLAVIMADGSAAITFSNVPVGVFPVQVQKVMSTNTTAGNIVALY